MSRRTGKPLYEPATGKPMMDSVTGKPAFWMPRIFTPGNVSPNVLKMHIGWATNGTDDEHFAHFMSNVVYYINPMGYYSGDMSVLFDAQINDETKIDDGSGVLTLDENVLLNPKFIDQGDGNESCAIRVFQNGTELWQRDSFSFTGKTVTVSAPHKAGDSYLISYIPESSVPTLDFQYPFSNATIFLNAPNSKGAFYFGWNLEVNQTPKGGGYGQFSEGVTDLGQFNSILTADKGKLTERAKTIPCHEYIQWEIIEG